MLHLIFLDSQLELDLIKNASEVQQPLKDLVQKYNEEPLHSFRPVSYDTYMPHFLDTKNHWYVLPSKNWNEPVSKLVQ